MKRYAIIPARKNSKGIPRKNLYIVGGQPLLYYTITAALESMVFDEIIVSSECNEILSYSLEMGVVADARPMRLASDKVHAINVILDYIERHHLKADSVICMLLPTSPLRKPHHIKAAYKTYINANCDSVVSVYLDKKHIMNFRRINEENMLEPLFEGNLNVQRQNMDPLYVVNGSIYISNANKLLRNKSFHVGNVSPFLMNKKDSIDINDIEDIEAVEKEMRTWK